MCEHRWNDKELARGVVTYMIAASTAEVRGGAYACAVYDVTVMRTCSRCNANEVMGRRENGPAHYLEDHQEMRLAVAVVLEAMPEIISTCVRADKKAGLIIKDGDEP